MSRRGWLLFVAMGVIWGVPYLLIKVAVEEISPSVLVLGRTALAGALLLPVALARGHLRGLRSSWLPIAGLRAGRDRRTVAAARRRGAAAVPSLTGLLLASVPLVAALIAWLGAGRWTSADERPDLRRVIGLLVGLAGVAALVGLRGRGGRHGRRGRGGRGVGLLRRRAR